MSAREDEEKSGHSSSHVEGEEAPRAQREPLTGSTVEAKARESALLNVPSDESVKTSGHSRSSSPSRLSSELKLRMQTQMNRMRSLNLILSSIMESPAELTREELDLWTTQVNDQHAAFSREHEFFVTKWPAAHLNHEYFLHNMQGEEAVLHIRICSALLNIKRKLQLTTESVQLKDDRDRHMSKLPDISLPTFNGDYAEWPSFSELFSALILDNEKLSNVERLHYLRGCLTGSPAQLISSIPLNSEGLAASWEMLKVRYDNKRLLIQAQLDKLFGIATPAIRSGEYLTRLISTVSEANTALAALGVTQDMWDCILVYHVSKNLDRSTREAWETTIGASQEYPRFKQLETFITSRARALERIEATQAQSEGNTQTRQRTHSALLTTNNTSNTESTKYGCDFCQRDHFIVMCSSFRNLSTSERAKVAINNRLCFNCLGRHNASNCRSRHGCKICFSKHHTMLHGATPASSATANAALLTSQSTHKVRLLIDSGSEVSFASDQLIKTLKIHKTSSSILINGIAGSGETHTNGIVSIKLISNYNNSQVTIRAHVLKTLPTSLPSVRTPSANQWKHIAGLQLADPDFFTPRPIDIIIGADSYGEVIKPDIIKGLPNAPIAQLSIFGWLVIGPVTEISSLSHSSLHGITQGMYDKVDDLLTKFWIQEEPPTMQSKLLTKDEEDCEQHFKKTHQRTTSGRYIVRLPLKFDKALLGQSYHTAARCLQRLQRKLEMDHSLSQLYHDFMKEYEQLGHMVPALDLRPSAPHYYLPHHGVLRPGSSTTKLRVVFNGSSLTSSGYSLNDIMQTGENQLLNITDVLIWIRFHKYIFSTDITKMYRQVMIHPDDHNLQRILWFNQNGEVTPYKLTTVTYGTKAAPFLAVRALIQLVTDEGHRFPLATESILRGRYVDDIFGGADTPDKLIKIAHQLKDLCTAGGFPLAKWHSNYEDTAQFSDTSTISAATVSLDDCTTKILGMKWTPHDDTFGFSPSLNSHMRTLTKRALLSEVAQIFDPLGFISPVVITAKILLQELWLLKLSWDEPLPNAICTQWNHIKEDFSHLTSLSIPRWINTWSDSAVEIHGFADASQRAMAAVVYITTYSPSTGLNVSFVCSKTKVAPLKRLTIPRLELTAALLLAKLVKYVQATLSLDIRATHLWTDSQVTLMWIRSHASRWKDYVQNRVSQIQALSPDNSWYHVPGDSNPADCASRGLTAKQLTTHHLWWTGPPWITQPRDTWPSQPSLSDEDLTMESRPVITLHATTKQQDCHWDLINRYSSIKRLFSITALCFRAISIMKRTHSPGTLGGLTAPEVRRAQLFWTKATQSAFFGQELKALKSNTSLPAAHPFNRLTAFIDQDGIIRVGGRLTQSALTYDNKHPAILPKHSRLTSLVISDAHRTTLHGGTQLTIAHIRRSYWIIGGRPPVKAHILRCVICARQRGIRAQQLMGQLPLSRVTPSRPFSHSGLDYAGPLTLKTWKGRGAKTQKGWICLFVCFSTSAVHIEAVTDYSTEGFIAAYRRFIARRGIPCTLYSDRGTNFQGAESSLQRLFAESSREHHSIANVLAHDRTEWRFNPPAAPHMGGKWETVVKSIKFHLRRTIGDNRLTFEEFTTLLSQIEATLNSRPLEQLSDDPEDISALTPGHFLIGNALTNLPEPTHKEMHITRLNRWKFIQQRLQHFWFHWSSQYLQRLQEISKWHHPSTSIKIGTLVLLTDERLPPSKWPLARVLDLHPGKDGLTRVVTLKTATTTLTRPVTKLAVLPVDTSEQLNPSTTQQ